MQEISAGLRKDMEAKGIDISLTLRLLEDSNSGLHDGTMPVRPKAVPPIDGSTVIDLRQLSDKARPRFSFDLSKAEENLAGFGIRLPAATRIAKTPGGPTRAEFGISALRAIGDALLPFTAYGLLNGGSATSYADGKKNLALGIETFQAVEEAFSRLSPLCRDMPKGVTPAYVNTDGSPGASFLELKMRARLLLAAGRDLPPTGRNFLPLFQMTSDFNDALLSGYYAKSSHSPFLESLSGSLGIEPADWRTGVQPMIAAFSHSSEGKPRRIFDKAYGLEDSSLPLPGGHGQCFHVLAGVLAELHGQGIRFACLGNVDNLGYTPDPVELAVMAISGRPAGFDFAFRTAMDVKGGILVETEEGGFTVADIGAAISLDKVRELEETGRPVLFNCASGIFDLDYLVPRIDQVASELPVRFSDQDKDSGRYSQAEQVTWEVMGLLPAFLAFAVEKSDRFLASKLLVDTLLTSGIGADNPSLPGNVGNTAAEMHRGLEALLRRVYGLELADGRWIPRELLT